MEILNLIMNVVLCVLCSIVIENTKKGQKWSEKSPHN